MENILRDFPRDFHGIAKRLAHFFPFLSASEEDDHQSRDGLSNGERQHQQESGKAVPISNASNSGATAEGNARQAEGVGRHYCTTVADEAKLDRMPAGAGQERLCVGDVVERDIDGVWFPAEVSAGFAYAENRGAFEKIWLCFQMPNRYVGAPSGSCLVSGRQLFIFTHCSPRSTKYTGTQKR